MKSLIFILTGLHSSRRHNKRKGQKKDKEELQRRFGVHVEEEQEGSERWQRNGKRERVLKKVNFMEYFGNGVYMEEGITHSIFNEKTSTIAWSKVNLNFNIFINYWFFQSISKSNIVDVFQLSCPCTTINVPFSTHHSLLWIYQGILRKIYF